MNGWLADWYAGAALPIRGPAGEAGDPPGAPDPDPTRGEDTLHPQRRELQRVHSVVQCSEQCC